MAPISQWWLHVLTEPKPYFSFNESTLLLFELSIQTLATSPNRYAPGMPGSTANSSYLVKGIRPALSFSQECGMAELLTKSDKLDSQSHCFRVMPQTLCFFLCTGTIIRQMCIQTITKTLVISIQMRIKQYANNYTSADAK